MILDYDPEKKGMEIRLLISVEEADVLQNDFDYVNENATWEYEQTYNLPILHDLLLELKEIRKEKGGKE